MGDQELRSELRTAALSAEDGDSVLVEHRGKTFEVRAPTLAQQQFWAKVSKDDGIQILVLAIMGCTYVPGTQTKVFEKQDQEVLMGRSASPRGLVGKLSKVIAKMLKPDADVEEAVFAPAPTGSSSSA